MTLVPHRDSEERPIAQRGFASRRARLIEDYSGSWASSSQDFVHLAAELYGQSVVYARAVDRNCSPHGLAGIPMLVAALRAFLVELYSGIFTGAINQVALTLLASSANEVAVPRKSEGLPEYRSVD